MMQVICHLHRCTEIRCKDATCCHGDECYGTGMDFAVSRVDVVANLVVSYTE